MPCGNSEGKIGLLDIAQDPNVFYPNKASSGADFTAGPLMAAGIVVTGSPLECGTPSPAYGFFTDVAVGEQATFDCPAFAAGTTGGVIYGCDGWTLAPKEGDSISGTGTNAVFTYDEELGGATLTWLWSERYCRVNVGFPDDKAQLAYDPAPDYIDGAGDVFYAPGRQVRITATAAEEDSTFAWSCEGAEYSAEGNILTLTTGEGEIKITCSVRGRWYREATDYERATFYSKVTIKEAGQAWTTEKTPLIPTGYVPNECTVVRAKYKTAVDKQSGMLFSAADEVSFAQPWFAWDMGGRRLYYNETNTSTPSPQGNDGYFMETIIEVGNGGSVMKNAKNGAVLQTLTAGTGTFSCGKGLWLLSRVSTAASGSVSASSGARADFYWMSVSERNEDGTETLLHEYVPCSIDGTVGIADHVAKTVLYDQVGANTALAVKEADAIPDEAGLSVLTPHVTLGEAAGFEAALVAGGSAWTEDVTAVWDFGDGSEPVATATAMASHVYPRTGRYSVTVSVTYGGRGTVTKTFADCVTVDADPSSVRFGTYKKVIEFCADGYTGTEVLTNFPVLVRLSEGNPTGFSYSDMKDPSSGAELLFADASLQVIPAEVDTWNPQGESLVWVKLPAVSKGEAFYMYYAGQRRSSRFQADPTAVWSEYAGVWHMGEADGACADSTGNGLAATPAGATENSVGVEGPLGVARQSATAEAAGFLKVGDITSVYHGQNVTMSGWVKMLACNYNQIIFACSGGWSFYAHGSTKNSFIASATANRNPSFSCGNLWSGNWTHIVLSYETKGSDATCRVTANGEKIASSFLYAVGTTNLKLAFGRKYDGTGTYAPAVFDELRLRKEAVSDAFAQAEYKTATDANFIVSLGVFDVKKNGLTILIL